MIRIFSVAVLCFVAVGCGGEQARQVPAAEPVVTVADYCARLAEMPADSNIISADFGPFPGATGNTGTMYLSDEDSDALTACLADRVAADSETFAGGRMIIALTQREKQQTHNQLVSLAANQFGIEGAGQFADAVMEKVEPRLGETRELTTGAE